MRKCMKFKWISLFSIVALLAMWIPTAARADVRDNAQIFTQDAVDTATRDMKAMEQKHNKQLVVETFAVVPDDQKDAAKADPKTFFRNWMASRAKDLKVNGVYVLICLDPHHVEVGAGKNTVSKGEFTATDVDNLRKQLQADLHDKEYDKALTGAVDTVERAYNENIRTANGRAAAARDTEYTHQPPYTPPVYNAPQYNPPFNPSSSSGSSNSGGLGLTFGSLLCLIIGGVIIVSLIRSIFRGGSAGGFGGGGYPGNQGYGGNYGAGYGGGYGGGGYGGGGGGFGRGFLGGLLGGALGGYAENRFEGRGNQGNNTGFFGGGGQSNDTGSSSSSSFDSGPSDAGQGFGDSSSGGDFGSSGGGGDSGGGGGDSGGGSSGGDF